MKFYLSVKIKKNAKKHTMKIKQLIKELDPDYHKCKHCKRYMLKSEMKISIDEVNLICLDRGHCNYLYSKRIKHQRK